jgi:YD repeat-containing protein
LDLERGVAMTYTYDRCGRLLTVREPNDAVATTFTYR